MQCAVTVRIPAGVLCIDGLCGLDDSTLTFDQRLDDKLAVRLVAVELQGRLTVAGERHFRQIRRDVGDCLAFSPAQSLRTGDDGHHHEIRGTGRILVIDAKSDGRVDFLPDEYLVVGFVRRIRIEHDGTVRRVLFPRAHGLGTIFRVVHGTLRAQTVAVLYGGAVAFLQDGVRVVLHGHRGMEFHRRLLTRFTGCSDARDLTHGGARRAGACRRR